MATLGSGRTDRHWQWLAGAGVPRTRPLPAASGGTSTTTSLPPDAADWFRQATAEATSNTTSVQVFPEDKRRVHPGQTGSLSSWENERAIKRREAILPSAVPRPTRSRHEASRKQELSSHYCQCSYCRGSKLKRKLNPEFSANRMNGTFLKCHLPNAEKDCKTRARVNFVRVGQIEEWMEGSKFAKWFPPTRTPIIPWHHNNPITLTENYSLDPISICNFHVHTLTLPLPNKSTTVDIL